MKAIAIRDLGRNMYRVFLMLLEAINEVLQERQNRLNVTFYKHRGKTKSLMKKAPFGNPK